jgi:hypothetical protein
MCCLNKKMRRLNHVNIIQFLSLQQIHYADLTFEDRPRRRKPLQLSQHADLSPTPYAEVMMPRV